MSALLSTFTSYIIIIIMVIRQHGPDADAGFWSIEGAGVRKPFFFENDIMTGYMISYI